MLNSLSIIGSLLSVDETDKSIRYLLVERVYSTNSKLEIDTIPLMNWNKSFKGELFVLPNNTMVAIKGRLETFNNKVVVICESITNLGLKY